MEHANKYPWSCLEFAFTLEDHVYFSYVFDAWNDTTKSSMSIRTHRAAATAESQCCVSTGGFLDLNQ
jgi:hypothetical protein